MKEITIQPVTRIEGGAKVVIQLDDAGNVADALMHVLELRGFERFCIGRPVEEMPRITTRICGVCPLSHHLASAKACDAVFGVTPPPAGRKLRELANAAAYMEEHGSGPIGWPPSTATDSGRDDRSRECIGLVSATRANATASSRRSNWPA
jgi:coenzyme F420-reducing hydrogenase alpha subunit